ncbi:hypothetical protein SNE40_004955 [Patella caerulea]|uniref:Uncharacterized protein n=1 Tax=Patella caerulea TaxID=87958 RepID=A0AAN8KAW4_PATCE
MLYVIVAALVGITTAIPTQPGCCVPPQWEGVQVDALGIVVGGKATVSDSRVFISYDEPNNRILTHYYITTNGDKWNYKVLQDFNKGIRYVLFNDDVTCQPKPLPGPFKKQCIPADAVSQGNVKLGVGDHTF